MQKSKSGFTIVELLIVIVVIAILASISVVAYTGIQNRANDSAVQADLTAFAKLIEIQRVDLGTYPATLTSAMGFQFSKGAYGEDYQSRNVRYCYNSANDSYVLVSSSKSGNYFALINGTIAPQSSAPNPDPYGYQVCNFIGLASTNPSQNGYYEYATPQWADWTN